jgi:hypothetical protein
MDRQIGAVYKIPRKSEEYFRPKNPNGKDKPSSHYHMFVITGIGENGYIAHMLTTATEEEYSGNKQMEPAHFVPELDGVGFRYLDTHFVMRPLIKSPELNIEQVGELTPEGVAFINKHKEGEPTTWAQLIR